MPKRLYQNGQVGGIIMIYHTVCPSCEKRAKRSEIEKGVYECNRCCIEGKWNEVKPRYR
jgi:hypothetical protein